MIAYMVVSGHGDALAEGLQEREARAAAQSIADRLGRSVWLTTTRDGEESAFSDQVEQEIRPTPAVVAETPVPSETYRNRCALLANQCVDGARDTYPHITATSGRQTILSWLQINDPNGYYEDSRATMGDDFDPMTAMEAWATLCEVAVRETGQDPEVDDDWCPESDEVVQARNDARIENDRGSK